MKLTVEHAIIGVVALALIYFVVQHRNLLNRDHSDLKVVKGKHIKAGVLAQRSHDHYLDGWMEGKACQYSVRHGPGTADKICDPWWDEMEAQGLLY